MDMLNQDSSGSHSSTPELRLILVGNIGCGKTLTADTLLSDSSSISALVPSRLSEVRRGRCEGRHLRVVETPRWYWRGESIDVNVQRETEKALSLVAPGPHAFLILVPVGQFTEIEGRIPAELERVFGRGALEHTLVLLTCGDYLSGRDHDRYIRMGEPGLNAMVNECGGRWHVINNRRPEDREQVISLLEKIEQMTQRAGGCYLPSPMQREVEDRELVRRYSLREEELVNPHHRTLTQTTWSKEETWDESGRRAKIRVRSMGPATGRVMSQQLTNGLDSQLCYDDSSAGLKQKRSSFKLSKEGAILSQMTETEQPGKNQNNQNFINTIHYQFSTMGDTTSAASSIPSPTVSYSPSFSTFSSSNVTSSSAPFAHSSSNNFSSSPSFSTSPSTNIPSTDFFPSSPTKVSSYSSATLSSSPTNALSSSSFTDIPSSPTNVSYSSSSTVLSSSNASVSSSSTGITSSASSSSTALSSRPTITPSSFFSSNSSDELRLVLLGRSGSGKSTAGNTILGRDEFKLCRDDATGATTQLCVKGTAMIGKKQVTVVDTPDWFWPPEKLTTHLSSCVELCAPGPHAFLLCVPVTLPGRSNLHDLSSLKNAFGSDAILRHTLVIFTHSDKLKDANVEEYIAAKRPELLELVEKCDDHYHVLKQGKNGGNIEELLEKVEQVVKESGGSHYSYQEQGELVRGRLTQLRRGQGVEDNVDRANSGTLHSLKEEEEVEQEEKNAKPVKSVAWSVATVIGSVLRFVGQKVGEGAKQVPKPVAGGAVLGGALGLYVGGPIGGAVGATAGSAAAEYGRRKYNKPKTD
ncbi:hypothetical protein Q7C36_005469 [Tachysurus vachellii]|uniref:AIG1-type G domain-containing protein n=1 Tax=Tachysurus vachellii TaxID=175792 RepID=A0AA88NDV0_TACVA|nr:hypothetical protein Q7C36_005469 [Tachysurus vachellii]